MNILEQANDIVNERGEDKERQYGPFSESLTHTAHIASITCDKDITTEDVFKVLMALKMARLRYSKKQDTLLDLTAYTAGLSNYFQETREDEI